MLRRQLRRHPFVHWSLVLALAATSALVVGRAAQGADAAREAWGASRPVVVAARSIEAGATIGADDVTVEQWPAAVVPASALDEAPVGRTTRTPLATGDLLRASDVAPSGVDGLAAEVPAGWRAVAVALGPASVALRPGDRVDLLATASDGSVTALVADDALVLAADDRSVTVALPSSLVEEVAGALATGAVIPVLRGG